MVRLPASLERRLTELFPKVRERERFIVDAIDRAIRDPASAEGELPQAIGGTLHLFTDGGSRGNPGQAAIGCIVEDPLRGVVLREHAEVIGTATNNVAEYRALIRGLQLAKAYHPNRLICHLDAELIVRQLNGQYRVNMPTLRQYVDEIHELAQQFPDIVFTHIPREDNYRADALVNKALDDAPPPSYAPPR